MKVSEHQLHGNIINPDNFNELFAEITQPSGKFSHRVWMWRGQSNIEWRIDSSAYRRLIASTNYQGNDINKALISYEETLLNQATHRGYRYDGGRELTDFELLAKLQHHGAATRLVDFTRNALIGLWFACNENTEKSGILIGYDSHYLTGHEKEIEKRPYNEVIENLAHINPVTWEAPGVSARIAAQHSQFIYSNILDHKSGSLALPSDEEAYRKFQITAEVKKEAINVLSDVFDINRINIFPDIDGFAQGNSVNQNIADMHRW
jgi:hypothetical protein